MVELYRAKNIPIDGYALDYDWKKYGEDHYGEFKWNTGNFPDAATNALKSDMDAKGLKLIGITKPRVVTLDFGNNRTDQYDDAQAGGYWYPGHSEYTDYFIPVTVRSVDPYNFQKGEHVSWASGMKEQRAVMLTSVNLGQAKWGVDAGGFNQENGTIGNPTPEL